MVSVPGVIGLTGLSIDKIPASLCLLGITSIPVINWLSLLPDDVTELIGPHDLPLNVTILCRREKPVVKVI